jgi:non-ribosomal peptide synthetase component F
MARLIHRLSMLQAALAQHNVPGLLMAAMEFVNAVDCGEAVQVIQRLVLVDDEHLSEHFASQFIAVRSLFPHFILTPTTLWGVYLLIFYI